MDAILPSGNRILFLPTFADFCGSDYPAWKASVLKINWRPWWNLQEIERGMNKCKISASPRSSRCQRFLETNLNGIALSHLTEDSLIINWIEGTWLYFKLCKWATLMGCPYRLVNGVLWCISRTPLFPKDMEYCQIATLQIEYIRMCLKVVKRMLLPISCQQ